MFAFNTIEGIMRLPSEELTKQMSFPTCRECNTQLACASQQKCYFRNAIPSGEDVGPQPGAVQKLGDVLQEFGEHAEAGDVRPTGAGEALSDETVRSVLGVDLPAGVGSDNALINGIMDGSIQPPVFDGSMRNGVSVDAELDTGDEANPSPAETIAALSEQLYDLQKEVFKAENEIDNLKADLVARQKTIHELRMQGASSFEDIVGRKFKELADLFRSEEGSPSRMDIEICADITHNGAGFDLEFKVQFAYDTTIASSNLTEAYFEARLRYYRSQQLKPKRIVYAGHEDAARKDDITY